VSLAIRSGGEAETPELPLMVCISTQIAPEPPACLCACPLCVYAGTVVVGGVCWQLDGPRGGRMCLPGLRALGQD
jgi:hypothetical protein